MKTLLELKGITKIFGGIIAVRNVSFQIKEKEIVGLIGPNGAGKTTILNLISGHHRASEGKIIFNNRNITKDPVFKITRGGVGRTFQTTKLFFNLSVADNVRIGCEVMDAMPEYDKINNLLFLAKLELKKKKIIHDISSAEQRRLMIVLAACNKPKLLLLDEPTAGMNMDEVLETLEMVDKLRNEGAAVLIIEHNMRAVRKISDKIVVLNFGEVIAQGLLEEVMNNEKVIEAYLGEKNVLFN